MRHDYPAAICLLWLIPAAMLVAALAPWPYAYYQLLRWVVVVCCGVIAYQTYESRGFSPWLVGLAALCVLFNPVAPIHLTRAVWAGVDLAAALFLAAHWWSESARRSSNTDRVETPRNV